MRTTDSVPIIRDMLVCNTYAIFHNVLKPWTFVLLEPSRTNIKIQFVCFIKNESDTCQQ